MARTKPLNGKTNIKQASGADLPLAPVKYVTQRGTQTSTLGQTIITLPFAIDVTNKDSVIIIVDGQVLSEGSGNDYTFTSINSSNVSSTITLNQPIPASGLGITSILLGMQVQQEPSINTLAATVAGLTTTNSSGGINYLAASDAEKTLAGWNRYANTAGALPVTATGGSPNASTTFTQSTVSPLRGTASFLLTKDAANRQGEGVSYDFTIDKADIAQVLAINFDFNASANFVPGLTSSDVVVSIYDKTNGALIASAPQYFPQLSGKFKAIFQTNAGSTSYRIAFHIATTNAAAWTLQLDNISVGPQAYAVGVPMTDLTLSTTNNGNLIIGATTTAPTKSTGTVTVDKVRVARIGDHAVIKIEYQQTVTGATGAPGSGDYLFTLPNNLSFDSSKVTFSQQNLNQNGGGVFSPAGLGTAILANYVSSSQNYTGTGMVVPYDATRFRIYVSTQVGQGTTATVGTGFVSSSFYNLNANVGVSIGVDFDAPILGWSSNVQMSSDTDSRVCAARYTSTGSYTANTQVNYDTPNYDTHGAVTIGASWKFTAPIPGYYKVEAAVHINSTTAYDFALFKNGTAYARIAERNAGASNAVCGSTTVYLAAGEFIDVRPSISGGSFGSAVFSWIAVTRQSGPAAIAATESINCRYVMSGTQSVAASTIVPITIFSLKDYDSHNAYTPAGGFVCPAPGKYRMTFNIVTNGTVSAAIGLSFQGWIQKASSQMATQSVFSQTTTAVYYQLQVTDTVNCLQGDVLKPIVYQTLSNPITIGAAGASIVMTVERVGN